MSQPIPQMSFGIPLLDKKPSRQERFKALFHYEPSTGALTWKITRYGGKRKVGDRAETLNSSGYLVVWIDNELMYAHRIIWFMETGLWPEIIDHINHDGADNSWTNLREVTKTENNFHKRKRAKGYVKVGHRWRAWIMKNGAKFNLGYFNTEIEASDAYKAKALELYGDPLARQEKNI